MRKPILAALLVLGLLPTGATGSPQPPDPELWVVSADGIEQRNFGPWHYGPASWAPDSNRVAVSGLLVIDTGTGEEVKITEGYDPDWSPVDEEIAFTDHGSADASDNVFIISSSGEDRREVTSTPEGDYLPTWSPDGQRIAFLERQDDGTMRLWVVARDGSGQLQLSSTPAVYTRPAWSPDGSEIAFLTPGGEVRVVGSGSTGERVVGENAFTNSPVWCPDGRLYYGGAGSVQQGPQVYRVGPDASTVITQGIPEDCSREGRLAFVRDGDILAMDPDETGTPNLTTSSDRSDFNARWSPDATKISFTSLPDLPPPVKAERSLDISLRKHLVIHGIFNDNDGSYQACFGVMRAQHLRQDGWKTVSKKDLVEGQNEFRMKVSDRKGYYRVVVSAGHSTYGERFCDRTASNIVRHRHGSGG